MKNLTVTKDEAGQRLDRLLAKRFDRLPKSLMYKYIRTKRIKVNAHRAKPEQKLNENDVISLYINDELLEEHRKDLAFLQAPDTLDVVYEDENVLVAFKPTGLLCHSDTAERTDTLGARLLHYLYRTGAWKPEDTPGFAPAICNRLDRNTCGLVLCGKNAQSVRMLNEKIRAREIGKFYLAVLEGIPQEKEGAITGYLTKDGYQNKVQFSKQAQTHAKDSATHYKVLGEKNGRTLVEAQLLTGRTHQLRVHFASIGCPIAGDGKYAGGRTFRQKLMAYKLVFAFKGDAGILNNLNGMTVKADTAEFLKEF